MITPELSVQFPEYNFTFPITILLYVELLDTLLENGRLSEKENYMENSYLARHFNRKLWAFFHPLIEYLPNCFSKISLRGNF
jgi:hypothetical protein